MPPHRMGDFLADAQAQPGPVLSALDTTFPTVEALENEFPFGFVDSDAPVGHV